MLWIIRGLLFKNSGLYLVDTPNGIPITIDPDDYGQLMIFYFPYCLDLSSLMYDILKPGDVCLDLGANIGVFTIIMASKVSITGKVVAVEPHPATISKLRYTIASIKSENIIAVEAGISDENGWGDVHTPSGVVGSESVEVVKTISGGLRLVTIDSIIEEYLSNQVPDFIKFDIEGSEAWIIGSMRKVFSNGSRPALLIEFHPEKSIERGMAVQKIHEYLLKLGYHSWKVNKGKKGYKLTQIYLADPIWHMNVLYIYRSFVDEEEMIVHPKNQSN
jgi:FkbM family methyltransferase